MKKVCAYKTVKLCKLNRTMKPVDDVQRYKYFSPIRVRYTDMDAQGRVFFATYLTYFDMALTDYFRAVGYDYGRMQAEGFDFYYVEALTRFKTGAVFEEELHVHAIIEKFGNTSFTCRCAIFEETSGRLVNSGHMIGVIVDRKSGKPVRVPDTFRKAVAQFENRSEQ